MVRNILLHTVYRHNFMYCCFGQNIFDSVFEFLKCQNKTLGPVKNLSWLFQESVMARQESIMALPGIRHGSERSPSLWNIASRSISQSPQVTNYSQSHGGLLTELPTQTDFSQSHDGLLLEPWRTPGRSMIDFHTSRDLLFRFQKLRKTNQKNKKKKIYKNWTQN